MSTASLGVRAPAPCSLRRARTRRPGRRVCQATGAGDEPQTASDALTAARDIDLVREGEARSVAPLAEDAEYADNLFCRFRGKEHFTTYAPARALLSKPRATVTSMSMVGVDTARIGWQLAGDTSLGPITLVGESQLSLNLITGRVLSWRDAWSLSAAPPLAAALYTIQRAAYNVSQTARCAAANAAKAQESQDDSSAPIYGDPTDPMKFWTQQDTVLQDGTQLILLIAVLYATVQALKLANGVK